MRTRPPLLVNEQLMCRYAQLLLEFGASPVEGYAMAKAFGLHMLTVAIGSYEEQRAFKQMMVVLAQSLPPFRKHPFGVRHAFFTTSVHICLLTHVCAFFNIED